MPDLGCWGHACHQTLGIYKVWGVCFKLPREAGCRPARGCPVDQSAARKAKVPQGEGVVGQSLGRGLVVHPSLGHVGICGLTVPAAVHQLRAALDGKLKRACVYIYIHIWSPTPL